MIKEPQILTFPNENRASAIRVNDPANLLIALEKIGLQESRPVIVIVGGAGNMAEGSLPEESFNRLRQLFIDVLAPIAEKLGAHVVDGGTDVGVMRMMGKARAEIAAKFPLIGVAPVEKVELPNASSPTTKETLEPNHTHFLLTPGSTWSDESSWLARTATALSGELPSVVVLINGGETALVDVTENIRAGRPVIALAGSGRFADELVAAIDYVESGVREPVAKLLKVGQVTKFDLFRPSSDLAELLKQYLSLKENKNPPNLVLLRHAWQRQQTYSKNATVSQNRFNSLRLLVIGLSVMATILAVIHSELLEVSHGALGSTLNDSLPGILPNAIGIVRFCLLLVPIVVSVLLAGAVKFDKGSNWLLLRGSSEALKREIYFYRTKVGSYSRNRDAVLAHRIKVISERLKGSPVHQTCLDPYEDKAFFEYEDEDGSELTSSVKSFEERDNKLSDLTPQKYIAWRLNDQFDRYRSKAKDLDRQLHYFQWGVYILGGLGTFLVALEFETWVAATSALTAAFLSFLEVRRVEATLIGFNQAADNLYDTRVWWNSLTDEEKGDPRNFKLLVRATEGTLQSENDSWLNDMQDRLSELYGQTDESAEGYSKTPSSAKPKLPAKKS